MTSRVGMPTPSSSTALEPTTYRLLQSTLGVTAHFAFLLTEIVPSSGAMTGALGLTR